MLQQLKGLAGNDFEQILNHLLGQAPHEVSRRLWGGLLDSLLEIITFHPMVIERVLVANRPLSLEELTGSLNWVDQLENLNIENFICRDLYLLELLLAVPSRENRNLKFAPVHSSAKDYLFYHLDFFMDESRANISMADYCLRCLTEKSEKDVHQAFRPYAAQNWHVHLKAIGISGVERIEKVVRFLDHSNQKFWDWLRLYDPDLGHPRMRNAEEAAPTPVYYACLLGLTDILSALLNEMVIYPYTRARRINKQGGRHNYPMLAAVEAGSAQCVQMLLSTGANVNARYKNRDTGLIRAVKQDKEEIVKLLLSAGAKTELRDKVEKTAVHWAAQNKRLGCLKELLNWRADFNVLDEIGTSPLHLAVGHNDREIVELLFKHEADTNARNNHGTSPLHEAARSNAMEAVDLLLKNGADVNARDKHGTTPLHAAVRSRSLGTCSILHDLGADLEAKDDNGETPLHHAALKSRAVIDLLISMGANVDARSNANKTALHIAVENDYTIGVETLVQNSADPNALTHFGITPLHLAVKNSQNPDLDKAEPKNRIIEALLAAGADPRIRNHSGKSAVDIAGFDTPLRKRLAGRLDTLRSDSEAELVPIGAFGISSQYRTAK